MPNRILREGILTSERVNALNWEAEVFYRRLMSVVDDFGRYYAHPALLRAALYPLKLDTVRDANLERLLALVEQARLVRVYEVAGKRFLELLDFRQQVRAKESRYPPPPSDCAAHATQTLSKREASAHLGVSVFGDGDEGGSAHKRARPPPKVPLPAEFAISDRVRAWAAQHGFGQLDEHLDAFRRKCAAHGYAYRDHDAAFMEAIREDWAKLRGRTQNGAAPPSENMAGNDEAERSAAYLREQAEAASRAVPPPAAVVERLKAVGILLRKAAA